MGKFTRNTLDGIYRIFLIYKLNSKKTHSLSKYT